MKSLLLILIISFSVSCQTTSTFDSSAGSSGLPSGPAAPSQRISILQGLTTSTTTELNLVTNQADLQIFLMIDERKIEPAKKQIFKRSFSSYQIHNVFFEGLDSSETYVLKVQSRDGKLLDSRSLSTLDTSKATLRFAMVSCTDDHFRDEQKPMWTDLLATKPQMIFAIGDNVYATRKGLQIYGDTTPEQLWNRYVDTRLSLELYRSEQLVPTLSLWDDHDYGKNDGGRDYKYRKQAWEVFKAFSPQNFEVPEFQNGPGVSSVFTAFQQQFYFLDGRSFRSPNEVSPACLKRPDFPQCKKQKQIVVDDQTHFGAEQEAWLFDLLRSSSAPAWLMKGDQWFGAYQPFESFEGNARKDFDRFMELLRQVPKTFVFGSGDRHLSELMKIESALLGYPTYEVTSSALHARTYPQQWELFPNPRKMEGVDGTLNYSLVTSRAHNTGMKLDITAYGPKRRVLYRNQLNVQR